MKKTLLLASLVGASIFANAQITFGPKVGLALANQRYKIADKEQASEKPSTEAVFSPAVGVALNVKINDYFAIQPALQFAILGSKIDEDMEGVKVKAKASVNYIQLPVQANIQYPINKKVTVGLGVGPYLGLALGGRIKTETEFLGVKETETFTIKSKGSLSDSDVAKEKTDYVKPLDFGLVIAPFVQFGGFQLSLNYNMGLTDTSPKYKDKVYGGINAYNTSYGLSLAYFFGGK